MVQNKHFKALVRQRMAKTGERYTTARRHLVASRPIQPVTNGLVPGYPHTGVGAEAAVSQYDAAMWQRVLAQAGVVNPATNAPFSTAMLAGLGGGIGFMFATFSYAEITTATVILRAHPEPYTERLLERTGAIVDRTATTSKRIAATTLEEALEASKASVVRVTHGALPWVASQELEYQDSIDVAVVGKDGDSFVIDGGGRSLGDEDIETLHRANGTELAQARSQCKADKHWAVTVAAGESSPEQLTSSVRASIAETTGRLLGTLPLEGIPASWLSKFGVQGMRTWADLLRDQRTRKGWPSLFSDESRLRTGLRMVQDTAAGTRWGGPGGLRGLYADFLEEASTLPGLNDLNDVSDAYRKLAPLWDAFLDTVDPEMAVDERVAHFEQLAQQLEELANLEENAARTLASVVEHG